MIDISVPGSLDYIINEVNKVRVNSNSEMSWWEALNQLSIAAAVTAKDKRSKEAKNIVTALSGPQGKSRPSTPFSGNADVVVVIQNSCYLLV